MYRYRSKSINLWDVCVVCHLDLTRWDFTWRWISGGSVFPIPGWGGVLLGGTESAPALYSLGATPPVGANLCENVPRWGMVQPTD
jgi:hypothetical protein